MKYLLILLLTISLYGVSYSGEYLRQSRNGFGGYNYYSNGKLVLSTRSGFGRENIFQGTKKVGEIRGFLGERKVYLNNQAFYFKSGKVFTK